MSSTPLDPTNAGDPDLEPVVDEVESDHATLSYISTWLGTVVRAKTLNEAHDRAADLKSYVDGQMNALRAELVRLRTPDS